MRYLLEQVGLWRNEEGDPETNIASAWSILSRLGLPARYGGKAQDGSHEFIITDPRTGNFIATGKGLTLEKAICAAALNASQHADIS